MNIAEFVERNEGYRPNAYKDSEGYWTVGIGFLIDDRKNGGLSREECLMILHHRLAKLNIELCKRFPVMAQLDYARHIVITDMTYQMGVEGVAKFVKMWEALHAHDYVTAAAEMMDSTWAKQTPRRAERNAMIMQTGMLI